MVPAKRLAAAGNQGGVLNLGLEFLRMDELYRAFVT
jgi:hypothetical protein